MRTSVLISCTALALIVMCCRSGKNNPGEGESLQTVTPVTVTSVTVGPLADTVELNATSSFLLKTSVRAVTTGYIQDVFIRTGEKVKQGDPLFRIRSREAKSLGNTLGNLDSTFRFSGLTTVYSRGTGYVGTLSYQPGDYVQEGETLTSISDATSLVFLLNLPYELRPFLEYNRRMTLRLPGGEKLTGTLSSPMPFVDAASQTQDFIIRPDHNNGVPENLVARAGFIKNISENARSLPREAVLTNEQQTEFWIMMMTDSTMAVKVPVVKGIETHDRIEIVTPVIGPEKKILLTGNYGLPDTARVIIEK